MKNKLIDEIKVLRLRILQNDWNINSKSNPTDEDVKKWKKERKLCLREIRVLERKVCSL